MHHQLLPDLSPTPSLSTNLSVLSDTTVTGGYVTAVLAGVAEPGRHSDLTVVVVEYEDPTATSPYSPT